MAKIGEIIRVLRIKRGLSQAQLADAMNLKRSAVSNYELGIREPDLDTVEAFADFFDVSIADLMGREEMSEDDELWRLREQVRRDPNRRMLFDLAAHATAKDIEATVALIDALKKTNPDFYDGDDPA